MFEGGEAHATPAVHRPEEHRQVAEDLVPSGALETAGILRRGLQRAERVEALADGDVQRTPAAPDPDQQ